MCKQHRFGEPGTWNRQVSGEPQEWSVGVPKYLLNSKLSLHKCAYSSFGRGDRESWTALPGWAHAGWPGYPPIRDTGKPWLLEKLTSGSPPNVD